MSLSHRLSTSRYGASDRALATTFVRVHFAADTSQMACSAERYSDDHLLAACEPWENPDSGDL